MEWIIGWVIACFVIGIVANSRGRVGIVWFFISLVISPLLGLVLVLALPNPLVARAQREEARNSKICPACAETIKRDAKVCRFCGTHLA